MNEILQCLSRVVPVNSFSHEFGAHRASMRYLAVLLPSLLICGRVLSPHERTEVFNCGSVANEGVSKRR